jgi:hypothetical protein
LEREILPGWVGRGLFGYPGGRQFLDIGTPESYSAAADFVAPSPATATGQTATAQTVCRSPAWRAGRAADRPGLRRR